MTIEVLSDTIVLVTRVKNRMSSFYRGWFALAPSNHGLPSYVFLFKRMAFECEQNEVIKVDSSDIFRHVLIGI